jgi:hypothetical protein
MRVRVDAHNRLTGSRVRIWRMQERQRPAVALSAIYVRDL